eukprot:1628552-Ditylum_brightwellii.AAC.1
MVRRVSKYLANDSIESPFAGRTKHVSNKRIVNPYATTASWESSMKKTFVYVTPTIADMKPTAVAHPVVTEREFTTPTRYTST